MDKFRYNLSVAPTPAKQMPTPATRYKTIYYQHFQLYFCTALILVQVFKTKVA
jgi:hypothetical protein